MNTIEILLNLIDFLAVAALGFGLIGLVIYGLATVIHWITGAFRR